MGYAISFIALKGADRDRVAEALEATVTDTVTEPIFGAPLAWGESPEGWLILASSEWDFATPERVAMLSQEGEGLGCRVEDHVMASDAWGCRDGVQVWSIERYCEVDGKFDVRTSGELPSVFAQVFEAAKRDQRTEADQRVDFIFDVPADVCAAICGYRYDNDQDFPFTELRLPQVEQSQPTKSDLPIWDRLLFGFLGIKLR